MSEPSPPLALARSGCYLASLHCTTSTSAQHLVTYLQSLPAYRNPSGNSYIRITSLDAITVVLVHAEGAVPFRYLLEREWVTGYRSVEFERVDREVLRGLLEQE